MTLFLVELEPLPTRYTEQWSRWIPREFKKEGWQVVRVQGERIIDKITTGSVLDAFGTNYFKASQLQRIAWLFYNKTVQDNDTFFLYDGWFPGVEMIRYMADMAKIKVKIYSIFHAGTYDPNDFTQRVDMGRWARSLEQHWFNFYDGVFVATHYHRRLIHNNFRLEYDKIYTTGLPMYCDEWVRGRKELMKRKENIIVFPHRVDPEKQPEMLKEIEEYCRPLGWKVEVPITRGMTKKQYYDLLARSKIVISFSLQETWGIGTLEAVSLGCIPILPNRLSYTEMYPSMFLYNSNKEIMEKIEYAMRFKVKEQTLSLIPKMYEGSIHKMSKIMKAMNGEGDK